MTILHYISTIDESSGGLGAYMQLLTRELGKLVDLHVLTHKRNNERQLSNCTIHYVPFKWKPWDNCKREFLQLVDELHPDVVHVNCCWTPTCALITKWAKLVGIKVVYSPHGMLDPYSMKIHYWTKKLPAILLYQKKALQQCDLVHATSELEKKNILALGWNKNVSSITNCIQIDDIQAKTSWHRNKNILFLSRVHPQKGVNILIEAVGKLKKELVGYTITIAGPGEESYLEELRTQAIQCGVADIIHFAGAVYAEEKWPLYRKADLFVLPSWSESFGIVVAEALACGTPVITTKGAPWEDLSAYNCGWWIGIGTDPLTDALHQFLVLSEQDLERMGCNGRRLVEEKYNSAIVAKQFAEMYKSL